VSRATILRWCRRVDLLLLAALACHTIWTSQIKEPAVVGAVFLAVSLFASTVTIGCLDAVRPARPRPDYAAIARMERRIYGETFGHAGAPPRN
jgi:hypothetical protein